VYSENCCEVFVKEDITGLMVSQGNLLVGKQSKIPSARINALIAHEVETHVLTYLNGKSQRLQQLYIGFPGYDELQEGLAVLSEYMVGGLTGTRMRLLAARVAAARSLVDGASFVEVFNELNKGYGFERKTAFNITIRTFRGGGLTKDAVYLRGLVHLLEYLKNGGELEPLFVGKISADHVAIIKELQWRKILQPALLRPAYLDDPNTIQKLNDLKNGLTVINLIKRRKK
ncbi:flavohemoglobin expression-modulating QEGLA motif protein, partial [Draconibacterium sp.]|nr:flavohemoglobin expression-modulating QEGLA motif protein [Draconibacterium sp.]